MRLTNLVYSLSGTDAEQFVIESSTGQIKTKSGIVYNFEAIKNTYSLNVVVTDDHHGTSDKSIVINLNDVAEQPARPAAPISDSQTITAIALRWVKPANTGPPINDYNVRYINSDVINPTDSDWTNWPHHDITTETTVTGLDRGTTYKFQVNAHNGELPSDWSPSATFATTANAGPVFTTESNNNRTIEVPENTPGNTEIGTPYEATDANNDAITYSLTGADQALFTIGATSGQVSTGASTTFDYETAPNSYDITIKASDSDSGVSTLAVTVNESDLPEPPGQPNPVTFDDVTSVSMTLKWTVPPTNTGPAIDGYRVQYADADTGPWTQQEVASNIFQLNLRGLSPGQTLWAQVQAHNDEGWGDFSTPASADSEANTGPTFTEPQDPVLREVAENTAANQPVGAPVEAKDFETPQLTYALEGADQAYFSINGRTGQILTKAGVTYNYEDAKITYAVTVTATDGHGLTATKQVTITLSDVLEDPGTPNAPTATGQTLTTISITWEEPENTGPPITDYDVQYKAAAESNYIDHTHDSDLPNATITGLNHSTPYQFRVRATSDEGTSDWSDPLTASTLDNQPPIFENNNAPINESIPEDTGPNQVVTTAVATDPEGASVTYSLGTEPDSNNFVITPTTGQISTSAVAKFNYEDQAEMRFTVIATDETGGITSINATITITDVEEIPGAPTLRATAVSIDSITLEWDEPINQGPPITSYAIEYKGGTVTTFTSLPHTGTTRAVTAGNLTDQTIYQFRANSTSDEGTSEWSEIISVSTTNNHPPIFQGGSESRFYLDENSEPGTNVGDVTAEDLEGRSNHLPHRGHTRHRLHNRRTNRQHHHRQRFHHRLRD